ncbi:MAG: putative transporter substrate-binding protein [Aeromicrobium sp.]|nr:putative transporter substrate-binding protein [Aeromicrobium sp.]
MTMRPRIALSVLVAGAVTAAACSSGGKSLDNAGIPDKTTASTVAPSSTAAATTLAPGETVATGETVAPGATDASVDTTPAETAAPVTTVPTLLSTLPKCDVSVLDSASASGPVNITFWHSLSDANGVALQALTDQYNSSQSKVHVDLQFQGGYDVTIDKYLQSDAANRPDMVQMPEYMVQQMVDTKSIVPAQACEESAGYDTSAFLPSGLQAYATSGVQWSLPFNISVPVLFFLKPTFVKAGLDPANPPQTLDDLLTASKQIVSSKAATYSIALDSDFDGGGGWYVEQWLAKGGNYYADNDNGRSAPATKVLYDGPEGVALLTYLKSLVTDGGAVYVGDNASGTDALLKLADATAPAAMTISSSASLGPVFSALGSGLIPGITAADVGVGFMPGPKGGLGGIVGGNSLYIVDKGADKAAAVWDFMTYLDSAQSQSTFAAATGYIPVRSDALDLDPIKSTYVNDPRFKVAYDQLLGSADEPTSLGPVIGPLEQVRKVTATAVADVLTGGDPQTALTTAAQQADDLITNYNLTSGG